MGVPLKFKRVLFLLSYMLVSIALGEANYFKYKDPEQPLNVRINDLMSRMTLAEKIGQMSQIERVNATSDVMKNYFIGSVLSGAGSVPAPNATVEEWMSMVTEMQKGALSTCLGVPMIYGIDAVHGHGNVYGATLFPHNIGLGATRRNVAACAKHYVGDGGTQKGISENNTVTSLRGLLSIHMPPYYAIARGVSTIRVSYSSWNGVKMHANRFLITDYLKNRLHFKGFVISDYTGIDKITTPAHSDYFYNRIMVQVKWNCNMEYLN